MIPVIPQPEPPDFESKVREPGNAFLASHSPTCSKDWKNREYWRRCLPELRHAYNKVCAYSAHWVTTDYSTDHYIPLSDYPEGAYEWNNYRLSSKYTNSLKQKHRDVVDPFEIRDNTFIIDFTTLKVEPSPELPDSLSERVISTIERLKLNESVLFELRCDWLKPYCNDQCTLAFLKEKAPFTAYEIERQSIDINMLQKLFRVPIN